MRQHLSFACQGSALVGTLDLPDHTTAPRHGLLILSGGNEIRSGAHRGQAMLASTMAEAGAAVFRFDRRGIGDSQGDNLGFEHSGDDIAAALAYFREQVPSMQRVTAFGNCDAASALVLHHATVDALVLANPWVIEPSAQSSNDANNGDEQRALHPAAAIRARYAARLRDPREWIRLLTGGVDLRKLARGLGAMRAATSAPVSDNSLAARMATVMANAPRDTRILIAQRDMTAMQFMAAWSTPAFAPVRPHITINAIDSASHSFADPVANAFLIDQLLAAVFK